MWERFGVPAPISRTLLPFLPPLSEFFSLDSWKCDGGNCKCARTEPSGGRLSEGGNAGAIQNKPDDMWSRHFH